MGKVEIQFPVGLVLLFIFTPFIVGAACNPVGKAQTTEQRAFAVYGTYVIFAEKAADLAENDALPRSIRLGLVEAEERTSPVVTSLLNALQDFQTLQNSATENNLLVWVDRALPLVNDLIRSVKGAQE